ncbi:hypothetical protein MMC30_006154 [Trapelia coarctata]|nr:hypothetical protein [Trapelia coarctata]
MSSGCGPSIDTYLAIAACAVSLTALVCSTAQLLCQYLATADGYRRCQASVMGPWARQTRLRWKWSQFRFETLFTVPEIFLSEGGDDGYVELITGSSDSRIRTYVSPTPVDPPHMYQVATKSPGGRKPTYGHTASLSGELVCWLGLLETLHEHESEIRSLKGCHGLMKGDERKVPAIRLRQRSWDFMSPDTIRPHAVSNLGDIAILTRRLGMTWLDFRPQDGLLRAEGNGHLLVSTWTRSIGIILQYMRVGPSSRDNIYIPSPSADKLGFGILTGFKPLGIPDFKIGEIGEVYATADVLDPTRLTSRKIRDVSAYEPKCTFGFSDIIPLATGMLRERGSTIVRIPCPTEYAVGLLCYKEGFVIFHARLHSHISTLPAPSGRLNWVLAQYTSLLTYPEWEDDSVALSQLNDRNLTFLESLHDIWDATTSYFLTLQTRAQPPPINYLDLLAAHIKQAVHFWGDAWDNMRAGRARENYGMRDWTSEGMHLYWDYLPGICAELRQRGYEGGEEEVLEAWCVMMLRGFCWWRCHWMVGVGEEGGRGEMGVEVGRLPGRFWESRVPVYIG